MIKNIGVILLIRWILYSVKSKKDIWRNRLNFMEQTIYMALTLLMKSILLIGMRTSYVLYQIKYSIRLSR